MTETPVDPNSKLAAGSIESRAADVDVIGGPLAGASGSAVSFGEGVYFSVAHNFYQNDGVNGNATGTNPTGNSYRITLREGHITDAGDQTATNGNVTNLGNYVGDVSNLATQPTAPADGRQDLAAVVIPGQNGPTSSAIVFQNSADIEGYARSAGYPGAGGPVSQALNPDTGLPYDAETMMLTEGLITQSGLPNGANIQTHNVYQTEYLEADKDRTFTIPLPSGGALPFTIEGVSSLGGQSGSGVDLNATMRSADTRLEPIDLENKLMGSITYGTSDGTPVPGGGLDNNQTATHFGAGITPLRSDSYQSLAGVAENAAQANEAARDTAAGGKASPLTPQEIADKFDTQTLVTDQQGANGSISTFNGTGLNEISYMNQNVNVNMDLGDGQDTADYFYLDTGIKATIGEVSIDVEKTYTTHGIIPFPGPLGHIVPIPYSRDRTATDNIRGAENLVGTGSNDTITIKALSGIESVDARDLPAKPDGTAFPESDTLQLDAAIGPVTWTFDKNPDGTTNRESGTVSDGTNTARFDHFENVITRDGDSVDGFVQGAEVSPEPTPEAVPPTALGPVMPSTASIFVGGETGSSAELHASLKTAIPLRDAVEMLAEDEAALSQSSETDALGITGAMATPLPAQMYQNLSDAGVESVNARIESDMAPIERAGELLRAGYDATLEAGLSVPEQVPAENSADHVQLDATPEVEADYDYAV